MISIPIPNSTILLQSSVNAIGEPQLILYYDSVEEACKFLTLWGHSPKGIRPITTEKGNIFEVVYSTRREKAVHFIVIRGAEKFPAPTDATLSLIKV